MNNSFSKSDSYLNYFSKLFHSPNISYCVIIKNNPAHVFYYYNTDTFIYKQRSFIHPHISNNPYYTLSN